MTTAFTVGLVIAAVFLVFVATKPEAKREQRAQAARAETESRAAEKQTVQPRREGPIRRRWRGGSGDGTRGLSAPPVQMNRSARDLVEPGWPMLK